MNIDILLKKQFSGRILYESSAARPIHTAAAEIKFNFGGSIEEVNQLPSVIPSGAILLTDNEELIGALTNDSKCDIPRDGEWDGVLCVSGGILICGDSPRSICRAAIRWVDQPKDETDRISRIEFCERFTMWDNSMNQMYRLSRGFDRRSHFREIAKLGFSGIEINRYPDGGHHVKHRKFKDDSYAWYMSYCPALDAYVTTDLTRNYYDESELAENRDDLMEAVELAREYGLKPGFVCYEPRGVPEAIFEDHPQLRGSRIDHPGRSLEPRYCLDIAHPRVLQHYRDAIEALVKLVPELRYLCFWTQDSGSGIPFANKLYFGPNGSYLARSKSMGEIVSGFTGAILEAGRAFNQDFEVIMQINWEYTDQERLEITKSLPDGVTLCHTLGGALLENGNLGYLPRYLEDDRANGVEPYAAIVGFGDHDSEPIISLPTINNIVQKVALLKASCIKNFFVLNGVYSPPQSCYNLSQEIFAELIRGVETDTPSLVRSIARRFCEGNEEASELLSKAWFKIDEALSKWPRLNWYHGGVGRTQSRWTTRPIVPDMSLLNTAEKEAFERVLFPLPWDIARLNVSFEGGILFFEDHEFEKVIETTDSLLIPLIMEAIKLLSNGFEKYDYDVFRDQMERIMGIMHCFKSDRNLFANQLAINKYLRCSSAEDKKMFRAAVQKTMSAEIDNAQDLIKLLSNHKSNFFRVADKEETPFVYHTPLEDLKLKVDVMKKHLNDEPGPKIYEISESQRRKLAFGAVA